MSAVDNSFKPFIIESRIQLYSILFNYTGLVKIGQKVGFLLHLFPILVDKNNKKIYDFNKHNEIRKNGKVIYNVEPSQLEENQYATTGSYNSVKNNFYKTFKIPKNGNKKEFRKINAASGHLLAIQKGILEGVFDNFVFPDYITGFVKNGGVKAAADRHPNTKWSLRIDVKDYFPSIKYWHVKNCLHYLDFDYDSASIIAELCTCYGYLPQGAPTSPFISNLVGYLYFDRLIKILADKLKLRYDRYADDMFFSCEEQREPELRQQILGGVKKILNRAGFLVNPKKCSRLGKYHHHRRMGQVTIHGSEPKVSNSWVDLARIRIHWIRYKEIPDVLRRFKKATGAWVTFNQFVKKLKGTLSYIQMIYPDRGRALFEKLYEALCVRGFYNLVPDQFVGEYTGA